VEVLGPFIFNMTSTESMVGAGLSVVVHHRSHGGGSINRLEVTGDGLRSLPRVRMHLKDRTKKDIVGMLHSSPVT
jgi:hypothetical protein